MLVVLALISLPPCPLGVTAHPLPAEAGYAFKVEKSAVGRAPTTPCIDLDRHLAVPRITFKVDHPTQLRPESGPILDGIADWLHAVPNAALRVHSVYGVERIPDTQPHLRRGRAVVDYLVGRGITPDRLSVAGTDVIVRGNTPSARARRRAMAGFWFERRPYTPSTATDCKAVCEDLGLCALKDGRCVASDAGCRAAGVCRRKGLCARVGAVCGVGSDDHCRRSVVCDIVGACRAVEGRCQAVEPADCKGALVCLKSPCTVRNGVCDPGGPTPCARRERDCGEHGRCGDDDGHCAPTDPEHCRHSQDCKNYGRCGLVHGTCRAQTVSHCRYSRGCKNQGECTLRKGLCVAREDADCRASLQCGVRGLCSLVSYSCAAKTDADCAQSLLCQRDGRCRVSPRGDCQK